MEERIFFRHKLVVVLNQPYLRRHLHGDLTRKLKVVYLLLEAADEIRKIVCRLGVLRKTGLKRLCLILGQLDIAELFDFELAGQNVHCQFLHVFLILVVHFVHHADVFEQRDLMLFKCFHYFVNIDLRLVVLTFQRCH